MSKYGKVVKSAGPKDAEIAIVGESPADREIRDGIPFVGPAGNYLNLGLKRAGVARSDCYIMNLVPVQPAKNKFKNHSEEVLKWGLAQFEDELAELKSLKVVVAAGANPLQHLLGLSNIGLWRGSLIHPDHWPATDLYSGGEFIAPKHPNIIRRPFAVLPTYHPAFILQSRNFPLVWWLRQDLEAAKRFADGKWSFDWENRHWNVEPTVDELQVFVDDVIEKSHFVAIDTEQEPYWIVALATDWEVLTFPWEEKYRDALSRLLSAENVVKAAHNAEHDWTFFTKILGIRVSYPWVDTMGLSHILNPEMRKGLSPESSTRYTTWPYHEWTQGWNPLIYCGLDTSVCADIYWGQFAEVGRRNLWKLVQHDHRLQAALLEMSWRGILIDTDEQVVVEEEVRGRLNDEEDVLRKMVAPVVRSRLKSFHKQHLFRVQRKCPCCGGGTKQRSHCAKCAGLDGPPKKRPDWPEWYVASVRAAYSVKRPTVADLGRYLPPCSKCGASGRVERWLEFNPDSPSQVKDVIYRGLNIRPRTYMGSETVRYERLEPIQEKHPIITQYVATQKTRADFDTVSRLKPDKDGRLHPIFDPFGTTSGRVASKKGLIEVGTNVMNIPEEARRLIVAEPDCFFLYPDMEQIEARCVAILSGDAKLLEIFSSGRDSHLEVLRAVKEKTGFDFNEVRVGPHAGDGRFFAKKGTYAYMYGIRPNHLAGELGVPTDTARKILMALKITFPGVETWKDDLGDVVLRTRWIQTKGLHGRKFLDRIGDPKTKGLDYEILKKALSHQPQDMAAYVLALGLLEIREDHSDILTPFIHVHDALVLQARLEHKHEAIKRAHDSMERTEWGMHFPVGMSVGPNWYVASLKDKDKIEKGFSQWTQQEFLGSSN